MKCKQCKDKLNTIEKQINNGVCTACIIKKENEQ